LRTGSLWRDRAWLAVLIVCGSAMLAVATMVASRAFLPAERAVISTADWPWSTRGVTVQPLDATSAFRSGDVVTAIDGRPLEAWLADAITPWRAASAATVGSTLTVEVVRAGTETTVPAPLERFSTERFGGAPLALVLFGGSALALAFAMLIRRPSSTALRLIVVAVTCDLVDIVAWETGLQPSDIVARTPFLLAFAVSPVFAIVVWSSLLHLLSIYPVRAGWLARRPRAIALVYALPLLALAGGTVIAAAAGGGGLALVGRLGPLTAGVVSLLDLAVLAAIVAGYRRTPAPRRSSVRLLAITLFIAAAAILVLISGPISLSRPPLASRGTVALLALPVVAALALAVIRDHLFQVDLLISSRARIVAAREEERLRLRRELHDGVGPALAALGFKLDAARDRVRDGDASGADALLVEARGDVGGVLAEIRGVARELRPPALDSLGLVGALRQQVEAITGTHGPRVEVEADLPASLPPGVEVAAYRIVVEAVSNVARHAGATRATVRLRLDHGLVRVEILDDGSGIDGEGIGVGTRAMYERAAEVGGELTITGRHEGGTSVVAVLPLGRSAGPAPTASRMTTLPRPTPAEAE
jgi:signal transduction histidine kinase